MICLFLCSSVYRANPRNDTERPPRSTNGQPGFHPPPPAKMPANGDWIRPPSVAVVGTNIPPCRPVEMKRSPNFRPQDMSSPRIHNPGCNLPMVPITKQKMMHDNIDMSAMENRAGSGPACSIADDKLVPTRMAPAPPPAAGKRHRDQGYVDVVPNGFVTPKKAPKRPPLPQDSRTPQKVAKASSMSGSKPSHFVGSETSGVGAGGNGARDHEESSKIGGSPTVPPPDPPDSRHRFYSTHHAKSVVGQGSGVVISPGNPQLAANSNHVVSHRRNKHDMLRLEMQDDRTGNGRDPLAGRQSSEKTRESKSAPPHKKGPSLITQESFGAVHCPPAISGHQATTTGSALRSQRC